MFPKILLGFLILSIVTSCATKQSVENLQTLPTEQQTVTNTDATLGNPAVLPPKKEVKSVNID